MIQNVPFLCSHANPIEFVCITEFCRNSTIFNCQNQCLQFIHYPENDYQPQKMKQLKDYCKKQSLDSLINDLNQKSKGNHWKAHEQLIPWIDSMINTFEEIKKLILQKRDRLSGLQRHQRQFLNFLRNRNYKTSQGVGLGYKVKNSLLKRPNSNFQVLKSQVQNIIAEVQADIQKALFKFGKQLNIPQISKMKQLRGNYNYLANKNLIKICKQESFDDNFNFQGELINHQNNQKIQKLSIGRWYGNVLEMMSTIKGNYNIQKVHINFNPSMLSEILQLQNIYSIQCDIHYLKAPFVFEIFNKNFPKLKQLKLNDWYSCNQQFQILKENCFNLQSLSIKDSNLLWTNFIILANKKFFPFIKKIVLKRIKITADFEQTKNKYMFLSGLEELSIDKQDMNANQMISLICKFTGLKKLKFLIDTDYSCHISRIFKELKQLQSLCFNTLAQDHYPKLMKQTKQIENNLNITNYNPYKLRNLYSLDLVRSKIDSDVLSLLLSDVNSLIQLNYQIFNHKEIGILRIIENNNKLKSLKIFNDNITSKSIITISNNLKDLQELVIQNCTISFTINQACLLYLSKLNKLRLLSGCFTMNYVGTPLLRMSKNMKKLKTFPLKRKFKKTVKNMDVIRDFWQCPKYLGDYMGGGG